MAVYVNNLLIYTGTDYEQVFILASEDDETLLKLFGYSFESKMKRHPNSNSSVSFTTSIKDANFGKIKIELSSEQTSSLKPGRYYYDIVMIDPNQIRTRVIEGEVFVKKSVTR